MVGGSYCIKPSRDFDVLRAWVVVQIMARRPLWPFVLYNRHFYVFGAWDVEQFMARRPF